MDLFPHNKIHVLSRKEVLRSLVCGYGRCDIKAFLGEEVVVALYGYADFYIVNPVSSPKSIVCMTSAGAPTSRRNEG